MVCDRVLQEVLVQFDGKQLFSNGPTFFFKEQFELFNFTDALQKGQKKCDCLAGS